MKVEQNGNRKRKQRKGKKKLKINIYQKKWNKNYSENAKFMQILCIFLFPAPFVFLFDCTFVSSAFSCTAMHFRIAICFTKR